MDLKVDKSVKYATKFKDLGNSYFKRHKKNMALYSYTKALMLAPYTLKAIQEFTSDCSESLGDKKHTALKLTEQMTVYLNQSHSSDEVLSQCFGNRSAVLFELGKYKECLLDIERAIKLGYPSQHVAKLHRRRDKCRMRLTERGVAKLEFNVAHDAKRGGSWQDDKEWNCNAYQSTLVSVCCSDSKGRQLIAERDIRAGEIVLSELPHSAVLEQSNVSTHCSFCFRKCSFNIIPCMTCACEGYCSMECRKRAWLKYHWLECTQHSWRKTSSWMEVMCLRSVVAASSEEIRSVLGDHCGKSPSSSEGGSYGLIHDLESHQREFSSSSEETALRKMAATLVSCFGTSILEYVRQHREKTDMLKLPCVVEGDALSRLEVVFFQHLLQLRCNTHLVTCVSSMEQLAGNAVADGDDGDGDGTGSNVGGSDLLEQVAEMKLGRVLLPTASLINHSCLPNAFFRFTGNGVQVCATTFLKKGQEICTSYGPQLGRQMKSQRKKELLEKFFFHCECEACSGSSSELVLAEAAVAGMACTSCKEGALRSEDSSSHEPATREGSWICSNCGTELSPESEKLCHMIRVKEKAEDLFQLASDKSDLDLLLECYRLQASVLHRCSASLAASCDRIAQEFAARGEFGSSCNYLELSCGSVAVRYGQHSIEYGHERLKIAALYLHGGQLKKAEKAALEAKEILLVFQGPLGSDYVEASRLINCMSSTT